MGADFFFTSEGAEVGAGAAAAGASVLGAAGAGVAVVAKAGNALRHRNEKARTGMRMKVNTGT